jgi:hypothetical protein
MPDGFQPRLMHTILWVPWISLRCTDLPPVPAARQLGLAADSDRPQAEAPKASNGPERVFALLQPLQQITFWLHQLLSIHDANSATSLLPARSTIRQQATCAKPRMTFRWEASVTGTKHNQITPSELHFA